MKCNVWSEEDWATLLYTIQQGNCLLMLGPDASAEHVNGQWNPLTEQLAEELFHSLEPEVQENIDSTNLTQVAQYYAIQKKRNALNAKTHFFYTSKHGIENPLYTDLAALPFYLTITSTPDTTFAEALQAGKKKPVVDRYNFQGINPAMVHEGTIEQPLVYHLYGMLEEPNSLVLTETDLIDFIVAVSSKDPPLPHNILSQLRDPDKSVLFLGFGFKHWYLRILLHVLYGRNRESSSFALERFTPQNITEFQQAVLFFSKSRYNIQICEQELPQFVKELRQRYERTTENRSISISAPAGPGVLMCHMPEDAESAAEVSEQLRTAGLTTWMPAEIQRLSDDAVQNMIERVVDYVVVVQSQSMYQQYTPMSTTLSVAQQRTSPAFNWLHLTDLHRGQKGQHWLWPGVREIFFDDLKKLHEKCGPWDMVLFTGDLTQQGSAEEFQKVDDLLNELWAYFEELGSYPVLLTVPGNHDLVRPDKNNPVLLLLRNWANYPEVQEQFWEDKTSPYRQVITQAFAPYMTWWQHQQFRPSNIQTGLLPGDFSLTFEKNGAKLGILGLNTSFLQLTDDDYSGKLALHANQFHTACGGDGPVWAKRHHACVLITHHSPEWLDADSHRHLFGDIASHGRFVVHLCGHLHGARSVEMSEAGTEIRRLWQGRSLFGLKTYEQMEQRLHGYTAGSLNIESTTGKVFFWPREARSQGEVLNIAADTSFRLTDNDHTQPGEFELLRPYRHEEQPKTPEEMQESLFLKILQLALERQSKMKSKISFVLPVSIKACPIIQDLQSLPVNTIDISHEENIQRLIKEINRDQKRRRSNRALI